MSQAFTRDVRDGSERDMHIAVRAAESNLFSYLHGGV